MKIRHHLLAAVGIVLCAWAPVAAEPLRVCATVPDLGDLARRIGGEHVVVTTFAKGVEDPHFVEARPSFIKALSRADVFIQIGMELEAAWADLLVQGARNPRIRPGTPAYIDASDVITPRQVPERVDRSMGDVHAAGNPHYLLDPENGRLVARLLAERFGALRPDLRDDFDARYATFAVELDERLARWQAVMAPWKGTAYVADHDMWSYFGERFGLEAAGFLEPKPGMQPTTRHMETVIRDMQAREIPVVITSSYYDPRHARFVMSQTAAREAPLAHQVGARPGTDDYLAMFDYNVSTLERTLKPRE